MTFRKGGTFLLNTIWEGDELAKNMPNKIKRYLAENDITLYYINASKMAQGNRSGQLDKHDSPKRILQNHQRDTC